MMALIVALCVAVFMSACFVAYVLGFTMAADDAEARLRGRKPVDPFWARRGMR